MSGKDVGHVPGRFRSVDETSPHFRSRTEPDRRMLGSMADVTYILAAIEAGDPQAAAKLLPLIYAELRALAAARMAPEAPDHTLQM